MLGKHRRIRAQLGLLVLVAILPVFAFATTLATALSARSTQNVRLGLRETSQALLAAVESELLVSRRTLEMIAAAPALAADDVEAFHAEASRALKTQPNWVAVLVGTKDGTALLQVNKSSDVHQGPTVEEASYAKVIRTRSPAVGAMSMRVGFEFPTFAVRVPVPANDGRLLVLSAIVSPAAIRRTLDEQRLPEHWQAVVFDGQRNLVASSAEPEPSNGGVGPILRGTVDSSAQGWLKGLNDEGVTTYAAYAKSLSSDWGVAIKVPASVIEAPARRTAYWLLAGGALAVVLAGAGVVVTARRIEHPLQSLSDAADAVGRGGVPSIGRVGVIEVDRVAAALELAARERQRLDEELRAAIGSLERAVRSRDEMLAVVSHDLANPLTAVVFSACRLRLARHDELASSVPKAAETIQRAASRMQRMISDLVDLAAIDAGGFSLQMAEHDPKGLLDEVVEMFSSIAAAQSVDLHKLVVMAAPIHCDRDRIIQCLGNLIGNAIKFCPQGKVEIGLKEDSDGVTFFVRDTGPGLTAAETPRVFERHWRGRHAGTRGLGLGLAIARAIVDEHGGRIWVESRPGQGATFAFTLPFPETRRKAWPASD